ncbi:MAG: hypothetical protein J6Q73_00050 [Bacteroidaceae bacterium]|nr:hypothetical protein [Bacteroidaceae bacterium]
MKNICLNIKRVFVVVVLSVMVLDVSAQVLRTGYFLDGNLFRHRLNPALRGQRGYFSLPVLGGLNINAMGNVGLSNFLYESPYNSNELVTFMHSSVSADDFLGNLESDNLVNMNLDITLLSMGFKAFGGYNTVDLTMRSQTGFSLPYDMFCFMKDMGRENYSFSDVNMRTRNFADLSFGHSRSINSDLTIGARLKLLFGLAYANAGFDRMNISMSSDKWEIAAKGSADIALGGTFTHSEEKSVGDRKVVDGYDDISVGLQGFGMGLDLGATYDLSNCVTKGLVVSASLTDVGFIKWNKAARGAISPENTYVFDGFSEMGIHSDSKNESLEDQWETTRDELEDFFTLEDKGEGSVSSGIGAKLNLGVEYSMPFYDKLSAGLLYTHCFDDLYSYNQTSLMISVSPLSVLDFALSGTFADYGTGFGAMATVHCRGFSFFIGTDCFIGKVGKQYIPLENMNASVSFGINIAFGK